MARLTKDQWRDARSRWEADERDGFDWLAIELGGIVSRQAISKAAKQQGWVKSDGNVAEIKVAQPKASCATKAKVSQQKAKTGILAEGKKEHGRPTLYRSEYDEQAYKLCLLGAVDSDLADFFNVTEQTINNWKIEYPNFFESLRKGKVVADANVAESLYKRCIGYSHEAEKIFNNLGEIVRAEYTEHYPPDTAAMRMWLLNRKPDLWKDKQVVENTHKLDKDMLESIKTDFVVRMEKARARQLAVLEERQVLLVEN